MSELVFKCDCGRTVRVFVKDGKPTFKISGTGDELLDALGGHEKEEPKENDNGK